MFNVPVDGFNVSVCNADETEMPCPDRAVHSSAY